jgi:hypothetical protein
MTGTRAGHIQTRGEPLRRVLRQRGASGAVIRSCPSWLSMAAVVSLSGVAVDAIMPAWGRKVAGQRQRWRSGSPAGARKTATPEHGGFLPDPPTRFFPVGGALSRPASVAVC